MAGTNQLQRDQRVQNDTDEGFTEDADMDDFYGPLVNSIRSPSKKRTTRRRNCPTK